MDKNLKWSNQSRKISDLVEDAIIMKTEKNYLIFAEFKFAPTHEKHL